jgi:SWI/SNF-related matrix-associated actin-dependent regulator 1 of chromatin subfamily A
VTVYKLIAKDSIEEYILKMANMKLRLDKNISAKEGDILEEDNDNQKQSLQSMIKEAFRLADIKAQQEQEHS